MNSITQSNGPLAVDDPQKILIDDEVKALALELAPDLERFRQLQVAGKEKLCGIWTGGGGKGWYSEGVTEFLYDVGIMDLLLVKTKAGVPAGENFGTSVGAMHAAAAARGSKQKYQDAWFRVKKNSDVYNGGILGWNTAGNFWTVASNGASLLDNAPLKKLVLDIFGPTSKFDDLPIPARVTAFCIADDNPTKLTHKIITLKGQDYIVDAIISSASIPLAFAAYFYKAMKLIDGGVTTNNPVVYAYMNGMTRGFVLYCSPSMQNNSCSKIKGIQDVAKDLPQGAMDGFEDNVHATAELLQELLQAQGKQPPSVVTLEPAFDTLSPLIFTNFFLRDHGYRDAKKAFTREVILNMLFGAGGLVSL